MNARILSEKESMKHIDKNRDWKTLEDYGVDFYFPLQLFEVDGRIVGGVQGQILEGIYHIGYFFIMEKQKGFGRLFIEHLKKEHPSLNGNALPDSISFWNKTGMTFIQTNSEGYHPFYYKAGA